MGSSSNGDYYVGRIDPVISYIEDNGNQVSHCLIFVTGVTNMEREKNYNKSWVIGLDLEVSG